MSASTGHDRPNQSVCQNCGTHVSQSFRRTFGDRENVAHRCPGCDSQFRLHKGSAAGRNVSHPDPQEQPNRNRGPRVEARPDNGRGWESYNPETAHEKRTSGEVA